MKGSSKVHTSELSISVHLAVLEVKVVLNITIICASEYNVNKQLSHFFEL